METTLLAEETIGLHTFKLFCLIFVDNRRLPATARNEIYVNEVHIWFTIKW